MKAEPDLPAVRADVARNARGLDRAQRAALRTILWDDLSSEYDARFYTAYLESLPIRFTPSFEELNAAWRRDEDAHHAWTRCAYEAAFGWRKREERALRRRNPDFSAIAHPFGDEFRIAALAPA